MTKTGIDIETIRSSATNLKQRSMLQFDLYKLINDTWDGSASGSHIIRMNDYLTRIAVIQMFLLLALCT